MPSSRRRLKPSGDHPTLEDDIPLDRAEDVYVLLLQEAMTEPGVTTEAWRLTSNGLCRGDLEEQLQALDYDAFPFDEPYEDYGAFVESLRFLDELDAVGSIRTGRRIGLTDKGLAIAERLREHVTDEQEAAIQEVSDGAE